MTRPSRRSPQNSRRPPAIRDRPLSLKGLAKVPPRGRIAALLAADQPASRAVVLSPSHPPWQNQSASSQLKRLDQVAKVPLPADRNHPPAERSNQTTEASTTDLPEAPSQDMPNAERSDDRAATQATLGPSTSPRFSSWLVWLIVLASSLIAVGFLWQLVS